MFVGKMDDVVRQTLSTFPGSQHPVFFFFHSCDALLFGSLLSLILLTITEIREANHQVSSLN